MRSDRDSPRTACLRKKAASAFAYCFAHSGEEDEEIALYTVECHGMERWRTAEDAIALCDYAVKERKGKPRKALSAWYETARQEKT